MNRLPTRTGRRALKLRLALRVDAHRVAFALRGMWELAFRESDGIEGLLHGQVCAAM